MVKQKKVSLFVKLLSLVVIFMMVTACGSSASTSGKSSSKSGSSSQSASSSSSSKASSNTPSSSNAVISIATTPVGASYNSVGAGLAKVISEHSKLTVSVKPYESLNAYGPLVNSGQVQMAVASGPDFIWSMNGQQNYKTPTKNLRLVVRGNFLTETGLVVRKDSGINKNSDLKGKRVAVYPGSGIGQAVTNAFLAANGLTLKDVKQVPVTSLVDGIKALQDHRVDAAMEMTPGTPIMTQVNSQVPLKALPFVDNVKPADINNQPQLLKQLQTFVPGAELTVQQPMGFIKQPTVGFRYPAAVVASASMSNDQVYTIMQTLWQNYQELHPIHAWFKTWNPKQMFDQNPSIPYHPGAVKFLKDKGLWTPQLDKIQNQLLQKYK